MTDKKQIKGLLDYISLKPGEEAEYATNSEDYVSGMGLGATKASYIKMGILYVILKHGKCETHMRNYKKKIMAAQEDKRY